MNKIQVFGEKKTQRKRRNPAVALPQVIASKIQHPKGAYSQSRAMLNWAAVKRG